MVEDKRMGSGLETSGGCALYLIRNRLMAGPEPSLDSARLIPDPSPPFPMFLNKTHNILTMRFPVLISTLLSRSPRVSLPQIILLLVQL